MVNGGQHLMKKRRKMCKKIEAFQQYHLIIVKDFINSLNSRLQLLPISALLIIIVTLVVFLLCIVV